jgi:hypothetical protein
MAAFVRFHVPHRRRERHFRNKDALSLDFTDGELRERYRFGRESIMFLSDLVRNDLERETRSEVSGQWQFLASDWRHTRYSTFYFKTHE